MNGGLLLGFLLAFDGLAIIVLYPSLDVFSCGYLFISTLLAVLQAAVKRRLSASPEIERLFYAKDIDKSWDSAVAVLGLTEFAVFFEYSHWRPVPELLSRSMQTIGLSLCIAGMVWLLWVDSYLVREFPSHYRRGAVMMSGPYHHLRHPRYLGLLATRLALPLLFGSTIAWVLAVVWFVLIRRRARLEERYLSSKFGTAYTQYAAHAIGIP
jgi:protein-S-isoprenylcysteine O-methyltransferase Ste14